MKNYSIEVSTNTCCRYAGVEGVTSLHFLLENLAHQTGYFLHSFHGDSSNKHVYKEGEKKKIKEREREAKTGFNSFPFLFLFGFLAEVEAFFHSAK